MNEISQSTVPYIFVCFKHIVFSLFGFAQVVQEYERAVIFRLGRLLEHDAKGPGCYLFTKVKTRCSLNFA